MKFSRSVIPNLFTLANLFCGFSALALSTEGRYNEAGLYIALAAIFDALDGVVARLTKSSSLLGVQLDSLCDAVSFGVVPSFMMYLLCFSSGGSPEANPGLLFASLPALAGVYRLARFNVELKSLEDKQYFSGMPIPAAALTIVSYALFYQQGGQDFLFSKTADAAIVLAIVSLAMISRIRYDNLPRPSFRVIKEQPVKYAVIGLVIAIVAIAGWNAIFPIMLAYIVLGAVRHAFLYLSTGAGS